MFVITFSYLLNSGYSLLSDRSVKKLITKNVSAFQIAKLCAFHVPQKASAEKHVPAGLVAPGFNLS